MSSHFLEQLTSHFFFILRFIIENDAVEMIAGGVAFKISS
jgi:hypothetical protein